MSEASPESPLIECKHLSHSTALPARAGVLLGEQAFYGHINLRGRADALQALDLSAKLPLEPNTCQQAAGQQVFWLGPDEWLIITAPGRQDTLIEQLKENINGSKLFAAVTDLSSGQTIITLAGPRAREVLAKGCSLDLHPRAFRPGCCAQTLLARAGVLIYVRAEDEFGIVVRRSFADYLWQWLENAADEYGFACLMD